MRLADYLLVMLITASSLQEVSDIIKVAVVTIIVSTFQPVVRFTILNLGKQLFE
tara:strand:- start:566 stop:727 length:162 start_codon:yes stop_codon:yes gene_type:complete